MTTMREQLKAVNRTALQVVHHPFLPAQVRECIGELSLLLSAMVHHIEQLEKERGSSDGN